MTKSHGSDLPKSRKSRTKCFLLAFLFSTLLAGGHGYCGRVSRIGTLASEIKVSLRVLLPTIEGPGGRGAGTGGRRELRKKRKHLPKWL